MCLLSALRKDSRTAVNCLLLSQLNLLLTHVWPDAKMTQPLCGDVASSQPRRGPPQPSAP